MTNILLIAMTALVVVVLILQFLLLRRKVGVDLTPVEKTHERTERAVREEIVKNREEGSTAARQAREELNKQLASAAESSDQRLDKMRETVEQRLGALQKENGIKLDQMRTESTSAAERVRDEVNRSLKTFGDFVSQTLASLGTDQRTVLSTVLDQLMRLTEATEKSLEAQRASIDERLKQIQADSSTNAKQLREEVLNSLKAFNDSVMRGMAATTDGQRVQMEGFSVQLGKLIDSNEKKLETQRTLIDERLKQIKDESGSSAKQMREEVGINLKLFNDSVVKGMAATAEGQRLQIEGFSSQLGRLIGSNEQKLDAVKVAVEEKLKGIQDDNAKHLGLMRDTVDEKLQGTLERRLGESFTLVSQQLKQVHEGLGEMQALASNVGDLKRVMTNVKTRGSWGEVMLDNLLAQVLSPGQYAKNVTMKEGSGQIVDFAIKLPGRVEDGQDVVWVPIDSKFPKESFELLCLAHDQIDPVAMESAGRALEATVKSFAKDICSKYLNPPKTTDFGIMFLPSEGLYAEVIRRVELVEQIQRECRILVAGPSVLAALLNSLQMGFKTLQIQKTSSEVWKVLGAVKSEFGKFGDLLDGVKRKLDQASNNIDDASRKSKTIERKLRSVHEIPAVEATKLLMLDIVGAEDTTADEA